MMGWSSCSQRGMELGRRIIGLLLGQFIPDHLVWRGFYGSPVLSEPFYLEGSGCVAH
jgi:hypothetical protein